MKTRTEISIPVKLLSGILLCVALVAPVVVEAGRGHHRHHHHDHYRHHNHHNHHRHMQHNHYNTRNIYYNQPHYPSAYGGYYGVAPRNFFLGINTGNARLMLGY